MNLLETMAQKEADEKEILGSLGRIVQNVDAVGLAVSSLLQRVNALEAIVDAMLTVQPKLMQAVTALLESQKPEPTEAAHVETPV